MAGRGPLSRVVVEYFAAIERHSAPDMCKLVTDDVVVKFGDAARNWSGSDTAAEKFGGMFEKLPNFTASYEIESEGPVPGGQGGEGEGDGLVVVRCHFKADNYDAQRQMEYTIRGGKIAVIDHVGVD